MLKRCKSLALAALLALCATVGGLAPADAQCNPAILQGPFPQCNGQFNPVPNYFIPSGTVIEWKSGATLQLDAGATVTGLSGAIATNSLAYNTLVNATGNGFLGSNAGAGPITFFTPAQAAAVVGPSVGPQLATNSVPDNTLANFGASGFLGNNSGGGATAQLTPSQANALTGLFNGATLGATSANQSTASTTLVMAGFGSSCTITPTFSTRAFLQIQGTVFNNTAADGAAFALRFGTGSAPAHGAANTGTGIGSTISMVSGTANQGAPFTISGVATGLTPGVAIWIDAAMEAVTGGTASLQQIACAAYEM